MGTGSNSVGRIILKTEKQQSAMEYLMTYGWSILVIAVVLGVLYQLGVFGGINFTPRATPGACEVARNAQGSQVQGVCQGELPEYVPTFGNGGYVAIPASEVNTLGYSVHNWTVTAWFNPSTLGSNQYIFDDYGKPNNQLTEFSLIANPDGNGDLEFFTQRWGTSYSVAPAYAPAGTISSAGKWYFVAGTIYTNSIATTMTLYVNGKQVAQTTGTVLLGGSVPGASTPFSIAVGSQVGGASTLGGSIADVQVYNTSLSAAEISATYVSGVGGVPVRPQNVAIWMPLNGNANDYGGNNYAGQPAGAVSYSSQWIGQYTPP